MNFNRHTVLVAVMLLCLTSLHSCGYDSFESLEIAGGVEARLRNVDVSYLRQNYAEGSCVITEDLSLSGVVTSSDRSGNFYKSFFVQDDSGAVEVYAGFYDLHNIYPVGLRVTIAAQGLALCNSNGVVRLGLSVDDWSSYNVDSFGTRSVIDRYVLRTDSFEPVEPIDLDLNSLSEANCGMLVRVRGVHSLSDGLTWADAESDSFSSYSIRLFADSNATAIAVITSHYACFADEAIPSGELGLTGILMYGKFGAYKERYVIKLRDLYDVEVK